MAEASAAQVNNLVSLLDGYATKGGHHLNVNVLNRLAEKNTLPPFYDGKVSQDRPYRREVANGVLQYVEKIVENRS